MNPPAEQHVSDLIPAYALDSLNAAEARLVAEHITHCAGCQAELEAYRRVVDALSLAAPQVAPPPQVKQQLMRRLPGKQPAAAVVYPTAARPSSARTGRLWARRLAAPRSLAWIGALLVMLLGASNVWLWQRVTSLERAAPADFRVVSLTGTENAPGATGLLVMNPEGDQGTLVVDGLPALDPAHQYQLWLIRADQRTSGGVFSVTAEGYGSLSLVSQQPLYQVDGYGVTVEPAGGSPGPTGQKVLGGRP